MDERTKRIGHNEEAFRRVNEAIETMSESGVSLSEELEIVCECGDETCIERIAIPHAEYERMRADPTRFAVKPHHITGNLERVVERTDDYWIIEKEGGEPAELAEELRGAD